MDYKGNYFKDDDEEQDYPHQSKAGKRIKLIFKIFIYSVSFLIYAVVLFMIFSSCEPKMINSMYFSDQAREMAQNDTEAFEVYKLQPSDFMNYDGSLQLKSIYYADKAKELEVGVQFNLKKITDGKVEDALVFILTDSEGNYYPAVNMVYDSNRKYGYARVSFKVDTIDIEQNDYYKFTTSFDFLSDYEFGGSPEEEELETGISYMLSIFSYDTIIKKQYAYNENGVVNINYEEFANDPITPISEHKIYNNKTVIFSQKYSR